MELPSTEEENEKVYLDIPTIDGRQDDASLRVTNNYQEYLALSIAGFAVLGVLFYQLSKKTN